MNYLQLVNSVLRRLRESEVTTVQGSGNNNSYARLVGDYVNEAKTQVEDSWKWSALKQTIAINTVQGSTAYTLPGTTNRFEVQEAYNLTHSNPLALMHMNEWIALNNLSTPPQSTVSNYVFDGIDQPTDNVKIQVYPVPDSVQALRFYGTNRPQNLVADSDVVLVPSRPVILMAVAMAIEERGEDSGQQSINAYRLAQSALADAIAFDSARQLNETTWYEA
jgi:hypothetical protein